MELNDRQRQAVETTEGPVLVIYPEGTWYTYVDRDDIDEIIQQHLVAGKAVERLKL